MKWHKQWANSLDSHFEQELLHKFKANGFLVFRGTREMVVKECGYEHRNGKATLNAKIIKQKLHVSVRNIQQILEFCSTKGELLSTFDGENFHLEVPNMLVIQDNYAQDLEAASKKLPLKKREERGEKGEVQRKEKPLKHIVRKKDCEPHRKKFEIIWKSLPVEMKKGKNRAWLSFKNQVKADKDFSDIQKALQNYIADVEQIRGSKQPELQFQNGSTWFNHRWTDYIEMEKPETWVEQMNRERKEKKNLSDDITRTI